MESYWSSQAPNVISATVIDNSVVKGRYLCFVVKVHVTVASGEGTKQRVQPLKVKVSPQTTAEGVTMEEVL